MPRIALRVLGVCLGLWLAGSVPDSGAQERNLDRAGLALRGYDPVAYFTAGAPTPGKAEFSLSHDGATYHFASAANRDAFAAAPEKFLPQYGGYCAYAVALGKKADADPKVWRIEDGKLYVNYNRSVGDLWVKDVPGYIAKADRSWPEIKAKSAD